MNWKFIAGSVALILFNVALVQWIRREPRERIITTRHAVVTCATAVDTIPAVGGGQSLRWATRERDGSIEIDVTHNGLVDYSFAAACAFQTFTMQRREP